LTFSITLRLDNDTIPPIVIRAYMGVLHIKTMAVTESDIVSI